MLNGFSITLTLTGDTWHANIVNGHADVTALLAGMTGDTGPDPPGGWNQQVATVWSTTSLTRLSSTSVRITVGALPRYWISTDETINVVVPASALVTSAVPIVAAGSTISNADCIASQEVWLTAPFPLTDGTGDYSNYDDCRWRIDIAGAGAIELTFSTFNVEANYDYVYVYQGTSTSGTLLGRFHGTSLPPKVTATGSSMYIRFLADWTQVRAGFDATFKGVPRATLGGTIFGSTTTDIINGGMTITVTVLGDTFVASVANGNAGADPLITAINNAVATIPSITTRWNLVAAAYDNTHLVRDNATTVTITLPPIPGYDPVFSDAFSDTTAPAALFTSATDPVMLSVNDLSVGPAALTTCDGAETLTAMSGVFQSSTRDYSNLKTCTWLIQPPNVTRIELTPHLFQTEGGYDFVRVYDGVDTSGTLLHSWDNNDAVHLNLTLNSIFVRWYADTYVTDLGFKFTYQAHSPTISVQTTPATLTSHIVRTAGFTVTISIVDSSWAAGVTSGNALAQTVAQSVKGSLYGVATAWDQEVVPTVTNTAVTRQSDTVIGITFPATSGYVISNVESLYFDPPGNAYTHNFALPVETFASVTPVIRTTLSGSLLASHTEFTFKTGGLQLFITIDGDTFHPSVTNGNSAADPLLAAITSNKNDPRGWNSEWSKAQSNTQLTRVSDTQVRIDLPSMPDYQLISGDETITLTGVPDSVLTSAGAWSKDAPTGGSTTVTDGISATMKTYAVLGDGSLPNDPISEAAWRDGTPVFILTIDGDQWDSQLTSSGAVLNACLSGTISSNLATPTSFVNTVLPGASPVNVSISNQNQTLSLQFPAASGYNIDVDETLTLNLHASCFIGVSTVAPSPNSVFIKEGLQVSISGTGISSVCNAQGQQCQCGVTEGTVSEDPAPISMAASTTSSIGVVHVMNITGDNTAGSVYGSENVYAPESQIARAAVHAGRLLNGESQLVYIRVIGGRGSYTGSVANSYTSLSLGASRATSYTFVDPGSCSDGWESSYFLTEEAVINGTMSMSITVSGGEFEGSIASNATLRQTLSQTWTTVSSVQAPATSSVWEATVAPLLASGVTMALSTNNRILTITFSPAYNFTIIADSLLYGNLSHTLLANQANDVFLGRFFVKNDVAAVYLSQVIQPSSPSVDYMATLGFSIELSIVGDFFQPALVSTAGNITALLTTLLASDWTTANSWPAVVVQTVTPAQAQLSSDQRSITVTFPPTATYKVPVTENIAFQPSAPASMVYQTTTTTPIQLTNGVVSPAAYVTSFTIANSAITVTPQDGSTPREGETKAFNIELRGPLPIGVTINMTATPNDAFLDCGAGGGTSFLITNADWNVTRVLNVLAVQDTIADGGHTGTFTVSASSAQLSSTTQLTPPPSTASVTVVEDDVGVTATPSSASMTVTEGSSTGLPIITISLLAAPDQPVTITPVLQNNLLTVSPNPMVFTPGNPGPLAFTLFVTDGSTVTGPLTDKVSFTISTTSTIWSALSLASSYDVAITDNDVPTATVIRNSPASGPITEGETLKYTVQLSTNPFVPVTITLSQDPAGSDLTLPAAPVVINPGTFAQVFTVTATDNTDVDGPRQRVIKHTITSTSTEWSALTIPDVTVDITDNDLRDAGLKVSFGDGTAANTTSEGASAPLPVRVQVDPLPFPDINNPVFNLTIRVSSLVTTEVQLSPTTGASTPSANVVASVPFPSDTVVVYAYPQTDSFIDGNQTVPVLVELFSGEAAQATSLLTSHTAWITVYDIDQAALNITWPSPSITRETGHSQVVTVAMSTRPHGEVVIPVLSSDETEGRVDPAAVTFTEADWSQPRTVRVIGQDDTIIDSLQPYNVTFGPSVAQNPRDKGYHGWRAQSQFLNMDNDGGSGELQYYPLSGVISEDGKSQVFSTVLAQEPASDVVLSFSSDLPSGAAEITPPSLTFTPASWTAVQSFTVQGIDDDGTVQGTREHTLTLTPSNGDEAVTIPITLEDNDFTGLRIHSGQCITSELGYTSRALLQVSLGSKPSAEVKVALAVKNRANYISFDGGTESPIATALLLQDSFTRDNWNKPVPLTVDGVRLEETQSQLAARYAFDIATTFDTQDTLYQQTDSFAIPCVSKNIFFPTVTSIQPEVASYLLPSNITLVGTNFMLTNAQVALVEGPPSWSTTFPDVTFNGRPHEVVEVTELSAGLQRMIVSFQPLDSPAPVTSLLQTGNSTTSPSPSASSVYEGYIALSIKSAQGGAFNTDKSGLYLGAKCLEEGQTISADGECVTCSSAGLKCLGGGRTEAEDGFYIPPGGSPDDVAKCKPPSRCQGADCAPGYTGNYCALCEDGYYLEGRLCQRCGTTGERILILLSSLIAIIVLSIGFLITALVTLDETFTDILDAIAAVTLVQAVGRMSNPDLPSFMASFYRNLSVVMLDLDFLGQGIGCGPLPFNKKWMVHMVFIVSILVPITLAFIVLARCVRAYRHRQSNGEFVQEHQTELWYKNRLIRIWLVLPIIVYVSVTTKLVQAVNCQKVGSRWMLVADLTQQCYVGDHLPIGIVSWFLLIVYSAGIPVGIIGFLWFNKKRFYEPNFKARFGFFYEELKPNSFFFSCANIVVELALVVCAEVLGEKPLGQFIVAGSLLCVLIFYVLALRPYHRAAENGVSVSAGFVGLCGVALNYMAVTGNDTPSERKTFVSLAWTLFIMSILLVLGSLGLVASAVTRGWRKERERKKYMKELNDLAGEAMDKQDLVEKGASSDNEKTFAVQPFEEPLDSDGDQMLPEGEESARKDANYFTYEQSLLATRTGQSVASANSVHLAMMNSSSAGGPNSTVSTPGLETATPSSGSMASTPTIIVKPSKGKSSKKGGSGLSRGSTADDQALLAIKAFIDGHVTNMLEGSRGSSGNGSRDLYSAEEDSSLLSGEARDGLRSSSTAGTMEKIKSALLFLGRNLPGKRRSSKGSRSRSGSAARDIESAVSDMTLLHPDSREHVGDDGREGVDLLGVSRESMLSASSQSPSERMPDFMGPPLIGDKSSTTSSSQNDTLSRLRRLEAAVMTLTRASESTGHNPAFDAEIDRTIAALEKAILQPGSRGSIVSRTDTADTTGTGTDPGSRARLSHGSGGDFDDEIIRQLQSLYADISAAERGDQLAEEEGQEAATVIANGADVYTEANTYNYVHKRRTSDPGVGEYRAPLSGMLGLAEGLEVIMEERSDEVQSTVSARTNMSAKHPSARLTSLSTIQEENDASIRAVNLKGLLDESDSPPSQPPGARTARGTTSLLVLDDLPRSHHYDHSDAGSRYHDSALSLPGTPERSHRSPRVSVDKSRSTTARSGMSARSAKSSRSQEQS